MQQLGVVEACRCQAQGCGDIADTVEETLLADVMSASGCLAPIHDCKVCWSDHLEVTQKADALSSCIQPLIFSVGHVVLTIDVIIASLPGDV